MAEYSQFGNSTGISLSSDVPCLVYSGGMGQWKDVLTLVSGSIVFIDEGNSFIKSRDFAEVVRNSSNYYVIVTREPLTELPYSINEIYGIRTSGRYHYPEKIYNEFYPIYDIDISKSDGSDRLLIVEDSGAGYQFFLSSKENDMCISAGGNSKILDAILSNRNKKLSVIADGAAFGAYIEEVMLVAKETPELVLYFPESFEWMILKSGVVRLENIDAILEHPEDFVESSMYFSWERFFAQILEDGTKGDTIYAYSKNRLADYYKEGRNRDRIMEVIPESIRRIL